MKDKKDNDVNDLIKYYVGLESHNKAIQGIKISRLPAINKDKFPERNSKESKRNSKEIEVKATSNSKEK